MRNSFLSASLIFSLLMLTIKTQSQAPTRWSCNVHQQIYAQLDNQSSNPQNDPSTIVEHVEANGYTVTNLFQNLSYPSNSFIPSALRTLNIQLNGIAINPKDGFLYGFDVLHGNRLLRIGQNGVIRVMGVPTGSNNNDFPDNSLNSYNTFTGMVGGACFDTSGVMYVALNDKNQANPALGRGRIFRLTNIANGFPNSSNGIYQNNAEPAQSPVSTLVFTDENADIGIHDLLFQIPQQGGSYNSMFVAFTNNVNTRGIKQIIRNSNGVWSYNNLFIDTNLIFNNIFFPSGNAFGGRSILGLSYNPSTNSFIGVTGARQDNAIGGDNLFYKAVITLDECGSLQNFVVLATSAGTGDGASIFPR
jgi:hypothetical protein